MKKKLSLILGIMLVIVITGCGNKLKINTEYQNFELLVSGEINAGCQKVDEDFSWNKGPKTNYILDYQNNLEEYKTSIWVGYNTSNKNYISDNYGETFKLIDETGYTSFQKNYRSYITEILNYINSGKITDLDEDDNLKSYDINFGKNEDEVFEIISKFGIIGDDETIKSMETEVTVDANNNVVEISFDIICNSQDEDADENCYEVDWNFSNINNATINLPQEITQ